jgi:hypothetical protein
MTASADDRQRIPNATFIVFSLDLRTFVELPRRARRPHVPQER